MESRSVWAAINSQLLWRDSGAYESARFFFIQRRSIFTLLLSANQRRRLAMCWVTTVPDGSVVFSV